MYNYDTSKLRGKIIEKFGSQKKFAEASQNSVSYISQYLNGKIYLDQVTIERWAELLDISTEEINKYFFKKKVHEMEPA